MKHVPVITAEAAAALVKPGAVLMGGGFGMTGNPVHLLHALAARGTGDLTFIANNVGEPGLGGGRLLRNGQLRKAIGSFFTSNPEAVAATQQGKLAIQLLPQGTLAEAIRAGGAGIGGFFVPASAGTDLAREAETRVLNGKPQVFVPALRADVAFIRAWRGDTAGNLIYRHTEQNFNRAMATAADLVIAEVEHLEPVGALAPAEIHTPGIFVDYLVQAHTTPEELGSSASLGASARKVDAARAAIAKRAHAELRRGEIVNLGVGIPTLVADLITAEQGIILHTENGMLGVGPAPAQRREDPRHRPPRCELLRQRGFVRDDPRRPRGRRHHGRPAGRRRPQPRQLGRPGETAARRRRRNGSRLGSAQTDRDHESHRARRPPENRAALHPAADGHWRGHAGDHRTRRVRLRSRRRLAAH
jgi:3-oxoacid CoA-transferase